MRSYGNTVPGNTPKRVPCGVEKQLAYKPIAISVGVAMTPWSFGIERGHTPARGVLGDGPSGCGSKERDALDGRQAPWRLGQGRPAWMIAWKLCAGTVWKLRAWTQRGVLRRCFEQGGV